MSVRFLNEGQVAYIMAQVALLNCERAGMEAENAHRLSIGESVAYGADEFQALREEYSATIGSNAIMEMGIANS